MAGKSKRDKIKLVSSAGTGYFYTTTRGRGLNNPGKLELSKYDPKVKKHVTFKETKLR